MEVYFFVYYSFQLRLIELSDSWIYRSVTLHRMYINSLIRFRIYQLSMVQDLICHMCSSLTVL